MSRQRGFVAPWFMDSMILLVVLFLAVASSSLASA